MKVAALLVIGFLGALYRKFLIARLRGEAVAVAHRGAQHRMLEGDHRLGGHAARPDQAEAAKKEPVVLAPDSEVLSELAPEVVDEADYAGSTAQMIGFVADRRPKRVALITECSMSDNVAQQYPDVEFVRPCNLCPHMKRNTLAKIRHSLETMTHEVTIDPEVADRARASVERMLAVGAPPK